MYRKVFREMFSDLCGRVDPVHWIDVGSGYGEILVALNEILPNGSNTVGVEPMRLKAQFANARGVYTHEGYLDTLDMHADVISLIDVFSHVPDFNVLLTSVKNHLNPDGMLFVETGNLADLGERSEFSGELGLPDHLVFAGEAQIVQFLNQQGFKVEAIKRIRTDTWSDFFKRIVKRLLGRSVLLTLPNKSKYRQLLIRAKLRDARIGIAPSS